MRTIVLLTALAGAPALAHAEMITVFVPLSTATSELGGTDSSPANGVAQLQFDSATSMLTWTIVYSAINNGMGGIAVGAHIHAWTDPATREGSAIIGLADNGLGSPLVGSRILNSVLINEIAAGRTYINIRSNLFPEGEIRGDIPAGIVPSPGAAALCSLAGLLVSRRRRTA